MGIIPDSQNTGQVVRVTRGQAKSVNPLPMRDSSNNRYRDQSVIQTPDPKPRTQKEGTEHYDKDPHAI